MASDSWIRSFLNAALRQYSSGVRPSASCTCGPSSGSRACSSSSAHTSRCEPRTARWSALCLWALTARASTRPSPISSSTRTSGAAPAAAAAISNVSPCGAARAASSARLKAARRTMASASGLGVAAAFTAGSGIDMRPGGSSASGTDERASGCDKRSGAAAAWAAPWDAHES
eukprot:768894-Prymnesium_polylepis.1